VSKYHKNSGILTFNSPYKNPHIR